MGIRSTLAAAMKIVQPETSTDLRTQAAEIRERIETARALVANRAREAQDAEDYDASLAVRKQIERTAWEIQRDETRLTDLERRITEARDREKVEAIRSHRAKVMAATVKLRAAVVAAAAGQAEVIRLREQAKREVGEHIVEREIPLTVFRGFLLPDLVAAWESELDRLAAPRAPGRAPAPGVQYFTDPRLENRNSKSPPAAPKRAIGRVGEPVAVTSHGALAVTALEEAPLAKRLPDDVEPLVRGYVRVRVLREGYTDMAGGYCASGRRIQLPRATAEAAAKNGAIEILESGR